MGDGGNAKGVLGKLLAQLVGEKNISYSSMRTLSGAFGLEDIVDKRLILSGENEKDPRVWLNTEIIKTLTTGEPVRVERKYENSFSYQPDLKMIFSCNRPPVFGDASIGMKRRMIIVPFERSYVEDAPILDHEGKVNRHIMGELLPELPGILAWSLRGWQRLRENDLKFSASQKVADYLEEYWLENDPYKDFVRTCIDPCPGGKVSLKELYACVRAFLSGIGLTSHQRDLSNRKIVREVGSALRAERIPFNRDKKTDGGTHPFHGIVLNDTGKDYMRCYSEVV